MIINVVEGCTQTNLNQIELSWEQILIMLSGKELRKGDMSLAEYQSASNERKKEDKNGMAWIPCSAIDPRGSRCKGNMHEAHLLVLDIDSGLSLAEVESLLAGFEAAIHSSYSHTAEKPKWRVVLPLKAPVPATRLGEIFDHFQERFDGRLDSACGHDPARLYFLPGCPADAEDLFVFKHLTGELLDGEAILETADSRRTSAAFVASRASGPLPRAAGVSEGQRNNEAFKRACAMIETGLSQEETLKAMDAWNLGNEPPLDTRELRDVVRSATKHVNNKAVAANAELEEIVDMLNKEYAWVVKHSRVYRFAHQDFVTIEALRQHYANTKMRMNVGDSVKWVTHADVWHRSSRRRQHQNVDFAPGKPKVFDDKINLWEGWGTAAKAGDISPWDELLDHIFAGNMEMRKWFEQWLAYPLQHPGSKLTTAVVLWSAKQGIGKSMIGETMCRIYGSHGKIISAAELHGAFNNWMRATQFVLGEENSSSDRRADSNKLKVLITTEKIYVNEKYQPAAETTNCVNFLFTSNHADAFYLEDADRRFFIWEITAGRMTDEFYANFVNWRDHRGGCSALMEYLLALDLTGFNPKGNAPQTEAKTEMIRQSKSDLERWLSETLEDIASVEAVIGKEVAELKEIADIFSSEHRCRTTTTAVSRALARIHPYSRRRVQTKRGKRYWLVSLINHEKWESADSSEWQSEYSRPSPSRL